MNHIILYTSTRLGIILIIVMQVPTLLLLIYINVLFRVPRLTYCNKSVKLISIRVTFLRMLENALSF